MSKYDKSREEDVGKALDGMRGGHAMQTRFQRMPDSHLSRETVAGIRDMKLGRVKNGVPSGAATIRFDTGLNTGARPHINIDPLGRPNPANPHIEVPSGVISSAQKISRALRYSGVCLTVAAVALDAYRIGKAITDDRYIMQHADEIIAELEIAIAKLKRSLNRSDVNASDTQMAINHLTHVLKDVRRTKKNIPVKLIKTGSAVAGGWAGGVGGGAAGAWAGARAGAAIGMCAGPAGAAVGAPIGAVLGAVGGGIGLGMAGGALGEYVADVSLDAIDYEDYYKDD